MIEEVGGGGGGGGGGSYVASYPGPFSCGYRELSAQVVPENYDVCACM